MTKIYLVKDSQCIHDAWCWDMNLVKLSLADERIPFSLIYSALSFELAASHPSLPVAKEKTDIAPIHQSHSLQTSTLKMDASGWAQWPELVPLRSMWQINENFLLISFMQILIFLNYSICCFSEQNPKTINSYFILKTCIKLKSQYYQNVKGSLLKWNRFPNLKQLSVFFIITIYQMTMSEIKSIIHRYKHRRNFCINCLCLDL